VVHEGHPVCSNFSHFQKRLWLHRLDVSRLELGHGLVKQARKMFVVKVWKSISGSHFTGEPLPFAPSSSVAPTQLHLDASDSRRIRIVAGFVAAIEDVSFQQPLNMPAVQIRVRSSGNARARKLSPLLMAHASNLDGLFAVSGTIWTWARLVASVDFL
jgi:hypothetical protein